MIEVRIHEDAFKRLGNEVLCAMHTLRQLREAGVPAVGNINLVGVSTGTLTTWVDDTGLDGDEFVYQYAAHGQPPAGKSFRFHEDGLLESANPFLFGNFIGEMAKTVPMRSTLSPYAMDAGALTMFKDETLNGDEYVYTWSPVSPNDEL